MKKKSTITSIHHGIEVGHIVSINDCLYKVLSFGTSNQFNIRKLRFYELWYYNIKSFVCRTYQYIADYFVNWNVK